jgi:N-acetylmuramoyl-L-alanine amidase-like protein
LFATPNTLKDRNSLTKTTVVKSPKPQKQLGPLNQLENADLSIQDERITADQLPKEPQDERVTVDQPPKEPQDEKITVTQRPKERVLKYLTEQIWLVEKKQNAEIYSNGLQIITPHTLANIPRDYYRLARNSNQTPLKWDHTNKISGILYHASESDIFPFVPEMNKSIKRYSEALIRYIKPKKSYHYFIDRFGRVYRLVQEGHAAYHAGNSIWADDEWIYLNLNHAFIGICFEGRDFEKTTAGKPGERRESPGISVDIRPVDTLSFNEAQLRSGKELTDWLRVKYNISQNNCVPHALASVNPQKMLIGYHLDLSRGFPFDQFGLSDKYNESLPSMSEFGFSYDSYFKKIFDGSIWPGIRHAEKLLVKQAQGSDMNLAAYVKNLQKKYSRCTQWLRTRGERKEELLTNPG